MAVIDLGTNELITGALPVSFSPFLYRQNRAYGISATFTSADFNLIYSYVKLKAFVSPDNTNPFLLDYDVTLDIISVVQLFYFPASSLFQNDGDVTWQAERLPRWRGAGDSNPVTLQLTYDDEVTTRTWR